MVKLRYMCICLFFILFRMGDAKNGENIQYDDIKGSLKEIFSYHVENQEFSPLVVKRSFKLFIEQFDPLKIYLLRSEVEPFLSLSDAEIQKIITQYQQNQFSTYFHLNTVMQNAIRRVRKIRDEEKVRILNSDTPSKTEALENKSLNYAETEGELRDRIRYYLARWVDRKGDKDPSFFSSKVKVEKTLKLWENRSKRKEMYYLLEDDQGRKVSPSLQEHYQSLNILKAIVRSLDAHSAYFSPEEAYDFRASLKKQFSGIGVVLKEDLDGAQISDLVLGAPAERSGQVKPGDYLIEIDGKSLNEKSFDEILSMMKGPIDSEITLGLLRNNEKAPEKVYITLKREKIVMDDQRLSFSYEPFADGIIGKVDLPAFYDDNESISAEKDFRIALRELKAFGKLYGLVVDMRNNSGGFLSQAVKVSGMFIPRGVIVISKYHDGEIRYSRDIDGRIYHSGPLILLTSKASASAAEIVAGSLQDYGVALIVGDERTYGKGSMQFQTITDESAKTFYKVTVGRYYTLSGRSTQIDGVIADIVVPTMYAPYNIGERFLQYPLSGDQLNQNEISQIQGKALQFFQSTKEGYRYRSPWHKQLSTLKENSKERLENNHNFQAFLEKSGLKHKERKVDPYYSQFMKEDFGEEDLQITESVQILKDMILIQQEKGIR